MKKNDVFGYIRVSDTKQIDGASLSEQERAIVEYAKKNNLNIIKWFEETKTAAKRGRPKFNEMLSLLKSGNASGVIIHKIDRSARNLHDWAAVGDLIDNGIQVHFAHESLDMTERGGRLSADIQAVMASDYVRNLRQETIKGIYGRLKQGIYPFCAPIGYLNTGKGNLKLKDPNKFELIQELFRLYITAEYNATDLSNLMFKKGLRNHKGNKVNKNSLLRLLKNPFYIGILKVNGKIFSGIHEPIINKKIFYRAQEVLKGRIQHKGVIHDYTFRKRIQCKNCKYMMSGEKQKGMVYYRCATKGCPTKSRREDYIERTICQKIKSVVLNTDEETLLAEILKERELLKDEPIENLVQQINFEISKLKIKEEKLLEAFLDNILDSDDYQKKKNNLVDSIHSLQLKLKDINAPKQTYFEKINNFLELSKSLLKLYELANKREKRIFIEIVTSNFSVSSKSLYFSLESPFEELLKPSLFLKCCHSRDSSRTIHPKIIQSDNNELVIANEWVTLINRPSLNKEQLIKWCDLIDTKFEYVPTIEERLSSEQDP